MNRSKKFMYNTIASAFQQLALFAVGLVMPRIILQYYGSVVNGLTSSIQQFINNFYLVEAGVGASAIFALYKPIAQEDHKKISSIVTAAQKFYIQTGYIFTALVVALAFLFPFIRPTEALSKLDIGILVLAIGAPGSLNFFAISKYQAILTADQRSYVISIAQMVGTIINAAVIIGMAYAGFSVVAGRTVAILAIIARMIIMTVYSKRRYPYLDFHARPDKSAMNQRWDALYYQILGSIQIAMPTILATIFISYEAVSVYTIFYMVIGGINGILGIYTSGLSASFGDIIARGEKKTLQKTYQEFECSYYTIITVIYAVALVLIMPFIKIYTRGVTDANYNVPIVGYLMVINGFLYNLKTPQSMLLISAGLYKPTRVQTTIQASILVVAGAALAPVMGLPGILIGCILSNLYRCIDLLFFIPKHVTGLSPALTLKRWGYSLLSFLLILLPFFFVTVEAPGYMSWIVSAVWATIYAVAVALLVGYICDRQVMADAVVRMIRMIGFKNFGKKKGPA